MTKIVVGDVHLKSNNIELVRKFFLSLSNFIRDNEIKDVRFLGDLYNQRAVIRTDLQRVLIKGMASLVKYAKVHIIVGNHDYDSLDSKDTHSLEVLPWLFGDKVSVYNKIKFVDGDLFVPYVDEYNQIYQELIDHKGEIRDVYCHVPINGFMLTPFHKETNGVPPDWFKGINGRVYAGHFHGQQSSENIIYPGSLFVNSFAEAGMMPAILVCSDKVDTVTIDKFVDGVPLYYVFNVKNMDEIGRDIKNIPDGVIANIKFIIHADTVEQCNELQKETSEKVKDKPFDVQFQYKTKEVKIERMSENLTTEEMFKKYIMEHDKSEEPMKESLINRGLKYLKEVELDADL